MQMIPRQSSTINHHLKKKAGKKYIKKNWVANAWFDETTSHQFNVLSSGGISAYM